MVSILGLPIPHYHNHCAYLTHTPHHSHLNLPAGCVFDVSEAYTWYFCGWYGSICPESISGSSVFFREKKMGRFWPKLNDRAADWWKPVLSSQLQNVRGATWPSKCLVATSREETAAKRVDIYIYNITVAAKNLKNIGVVQSTFLGKFYQIWWRIPLHSIGLPNGKIS